ncbi:PAS domain-containing protein [uncultured Dialister sp.]|jgi:PAS domain S-box-containing protein|uniref:PAS domain-containing protein n=1 Tax=uncultured Dialister sp. TaxID=278064 RepID=UPI002634A20A|nr:PAS domain-containing protein [uncultured Dialister sp.]
MDIEMVDLLHKMVDEAPFGMYVLDTERKIVFWSGGAERITGYGAEEMMGKHCFNGGLDHIDSTGLHLCHDFCPMMATIFDGHSREQPVFLKNKAGKRVPVLVHTEPLFNGEKTLGAIEYFRVLPESEYPVPKER